MLWAAVTVPAWATPVTVPVSEFGREGLESWEHHRFAGETRYRLMVEDDEDMVCADADAAASGLFREVEVDLERTPYLRWRWRIDNVYRGNDERSKAGDDYPARVYVVRKGGLAVWNTRAMNYVWSSNQPEGSAWRNAYTDRAQMVAVRSGADQAGIWRNERRNVREDFSRFFGEDVRSVDVVAIMSDADNTGGHASACYADIRFTTE